MESYGTSFLGNASDSRFYFFFVSAHHKVSKLIDDDDDHGHSIFGSDFCIVFFEISDTEWLQCTISSFHLCDSPLEGIQGFVWTIDHGSEEMRDAIIDPKFDLLWVDHDHTEFARGIFIEE